VNETKDVKEQKQKPFLSYVSKSASTHIDKWDFCRKRSLFMSLMKLIPIFHNKIWIKKRINFSFIEGTSPFFTISARLLIALTGKSHCVDVAAQDSSYSYYYVQLVILSYLLASSKLWLCSSMRLYLARCSVHQFYFYHLYILHDERLQIGEWSSSSPWVLRPH